MPPIHRFRDEGGRPKLTALVIVRALSTAQDAAEVERVNPGNEGEMTF